MKFSKFKFLNRQNFTDYMNEYVLNIVCEFQTTADGVSSVPTHPSPAVSLTALSVGNVEAQGCSSVVFHS